MYGSEYEKILSSLRIKSDIPENTLIYTPSDTVFEYVDGEFFDGLRPVFAGSISLSRPYQITSDPVNAFLMAYMIQGTSKISGHFASFSAEEGDFFMVDMSKTFSMSSTVLPCIIRYCFVTGALLKTYQDYIDSPFPVHPGSSSSSILTLDRIFSLPSKVSLPDSFIVSSLMTGIFSAYISMMLSGPDLSDREESLFVPTYLSTIHGLLHNSSESSFSLDLLAKRFGVSKSRLCHEYRKYYGISPIRDVNLARLERAKKLLLTSSMRIQEISNSVGFEDVNHFIRLFKKEYGKTPGNFRHDLV